MISVIRPGLLTSVQDLGRPGHQRHGIVVGGALDRFAARVANLIVGNHENAALIEMAQLGPELRAERDMLVAWCGGDFDARVGRESFPRNHAVRVAAGEVIWFGPARKGLRAWLAVAGGIDVPLVLGSRSTYRRAGIGGFQGRRLQEGDRLATGEPSAWAAPRIASGPRASLWSIRPDTLVKSGTADAVRAVRGPEWEMFTAEAQARFFAAEWTVTKEADRMGVRLDGPALKMKESREMISEAVNEGIVQVPAGGQPIVLLASRQTVGGYPRIAAVAAVDLGQVTQWVTGQKVRFTEIPLAEAHGLYLAREQNLAKVQMALPRLAG